jgi:hypothetical protein
MMDRLNFFRGGGTGMQQWGPLAAALPLAMLIRP